MANPRHAQTQTIMVNGRNLTLKRPMAYYAAERLQRIMPQIAALNEAGKSQADASAALETTICSLRTWLDLTGTEWINLNRRGSYKRNA